MYKPISVNGVSVKKLGEVIPKGSMSYHLDKIKVVGLCSAKGTMKLTLSAKASGVNYTAYDSKEVE